MNKVKEILLSYMAAMNPTEEQKELAEKRLNTCVECEHWVQNPARCGLCGCLTKGKVFTPRGADACPAHKWSE
jgi:hypothetical protein